MNSITTMLPDSCLLLRDGVQTTVSARDIVPGYIPYISPGNKTPADIRFVEVYSDATFDPSTLTVRIVVSTAFIPKGLPIALTVPLTITAKLTRKNKTLCKPLKTVATLGSISVILSDKTVICRRTDRNQMSVADINMCGGSNMTPEVAQANVKQQQLEARGLNIIEQLRAISGLFYSGEFDAATQRLPLPKKKINGDATDQMVLGLSDSLRDVKEPWRWWKKTYELNFNSKNDLINIQGAPDVLIGKCSKYVSTKGDTWPFDANVRSRIEEITNTWSSQVSYEQILSDSSSSQFEDELLQHSKDGLTFVGIVTQAIAIDCRTITNPGTMKSVSALRRNSFGYPSSSPETQVTDFTSNPLKSINVLARTTHEQKFCIIRAFQSCDEVVAMTGDGVNDAPSLKAANNGIDLSSSPDIAIEAADMILLESFSAIIEAINSSHLPQISWSFLIAIICYFTECAASTALAFKAPESDFMLRRPRTPQTDRLVDWKLLLQSYSFFSIFETVSSSAMSY
ncbi:putative Sodium/potassium-transporting ATPase subunit alpha-1 [Calycina marina]|uniref:Sodium/potassium-transporting ATPase subunit alpha-1 n=1 Tax=Calycina marina TaxID=1763456 RepID=A0A9P7Z7F8_9HELO|nr:putative Sodium/potassium-transporting ATPase subunit alpha-1 [Calycina marina]